MTDSEQILPALNDAFNALYHSLARYILDAGPYVRPGDEALPREMRAIAAADARLADRLAEAIERMEGVPQLTTMDPATASLNYLALDYLAGVLADRLARELSRFEQALTLTETPFPSAAQTFAHDVFSDLCQARRDQLTRLRALPAPESPSRESEA